MVSGEHRHDETSSSGSTAQRIADAFQSLQELIRFPGRFPPARIFTVTLGAIFLAEVIAMIAVYFVRDWSYIEQIAIDATIMIIIIYPVLYRLSFKPLLQQIQKTTQSEAILQARLRLMEYANHHTLDELLRFSLDEIESLTGASASFFHLLNADQKTIRLKTWSTNTFTKLCKAKESGSHCNVDGAGVWAEAIRTRQVVVHNHYAELPNRTGTPVGHVPLTREMFVPVLRDNKVLAILGLGNKSRPFTANDVSLVSTLADFAWDVVERKQAENALRASEEKFRTFADWTYDWELWLDPQGNVVHSSPSSERITGYKPEEFTADPSLLLRIVHPDHQQVYKDHHDIIHDASQGPSSIEYRILDRDGGEHWLEHICRPLQSADGRYLGRRISNRDITQRKRDERKIIEQNQKEALLTHSIQTIQTDIARDLHDTLGQNISFLRMNLEHLLESGSGQDSSDHSSLQRMTAVADESYELIRTMLAILQSGYTADPTSLFERYAAQVAERSGLKITVASRGEPAPLSPHQIRQLFYIFREALNNIEKYAQADRVSGEFIWNEVSLTFVIADNGHGFDLEVTRPVDHYGIKFMRERADLLKGRFSIVSQPGQGTSITVELPYEHELTPTSQGENTQ